MTLVRMMQPYHPSHGAGDHMYGGSVDLTLSPGGNSVDSVGKPYAQMRDNSHHHSKRSCGLEPHEDDDRPIKRARRFDRTTAAESVYLSSSSHHHHQPPHLPTLGHHSSMLGSHMAVPSSDAAFARYMMVEKQNAAALTGCFPVSPSPMMQPTTLTSNCFDLGGLPPPPLAAMSMQSRTAGGFLDPCLSAGSLSTTCSAYGQTPLTTMGFAPPGMASGPLSAMNMNTMNMNAMNHMSCMNMGMNVNMNSPAAAAGLMCSPTGSLCTNVPPRRGSQQMMVPRRITQTSPAINQDQMFPLPRLSSSSSASLNGCGGAGAAEDPSHAPLGNRVCIDISIDQDPNWLSELQCYVRRNLLEVCWASREDVAVRNASKKVRMDQVGIRCRFCAHKPPGSRSQRSSAFPSSIPQLYQSFTMMLRDHFDNCTCIPDPIKERYLTLKSATCQGATEAKKYWSYSAQKLGMVDSEDGIIMNEATRAAARSIPTFGYVTGEVSVPLDRGGRPVVLVKDSDHELASDFLYTLLSHFHRIQLLPSERKGNRKSLRLGLPGFGCRHCSEAGRFGMSRVFPARRRTLPVRIADLYDHICRCNLCPESDKILLQQLREDSRQDPAHEKQFLDLVWERLGHNAANP